jgi:ubiquinone/menaquinone biosynthesis C-methylase UbiE
VLAVGDALPFKDATFDVILSLAVLEHVPDPFTCARELQRVLKPGGKIMLILPFLQAEHGYPSHYFNATRFGAQRLFKDMLLDQQYLETSNHPTFTLNQILGVYASGLKGAALERFHSMTIADYLAPSPIEWLEDPISKELDPEVAWIVAWGTTSVFSKPLLSAA